MLEEKLEKLLEIIIDFYIERGEPIGSKFLYKQDVMDMAPSTLRKYMNLLEKRELVYRPHLWAWRVPTIKGVSYYLEKIIKYDKSDKNIVSEKIDIARDNLRRLVEFIWAIADGVAVWFLKKDEYYYLWIQNLLKRTSDEEYKVLEVIVDYLENKKIIDFLKSQKIKPNKVNYTFIKKSNDHDVVVTILYWLLKINGYKAIIWLLAPLRSDYRKNVSILKNILKKLK